MSVAADKLKQALGIINPHDVIKYATARDVGPGVFLRYRAQDNGRGGLGAAWQVIRPGYRTDPGASIHDNYRKTFGRDSNGGTRETALVPAKTWAGARYGITDWDTIPGLTGAVFPKPVADLIKTDLKAAAAAARPGNLKVFAGLVMVPTEWNQRVNTETHHYQAEVVVVAASKKAAEELLVEAGAGGLTAAAAITRELRTAMAVTSIAELIAGGVLDLKQPMILVYRRATKDQVIIRADVPELPIVGYFRYRSRAEAEATGLPMDLYVEATVEPQQ